MQEKQSKNSQQDEAAKRRRTLVGIIVLLILGFVVNYFLGDDGQETGQDGFVAEETVTPGVTQEAPTMPEMEGTPEAGDTAGEPTKAEEPTVTGEPTAEGEPTATEEPTVTEELTAMEEPTTPGVSAAPEAPTQAARPEDGDGNAESGDGDSKDNDGQDAAPTSVPEKEDSPDKTDTDEIEILYTFRRDSYLEEHFEKHGSEFDYATKEEYLAGANRVIQSPDALHKLEAEDGDDIYYLEETNEFVVVSTDGYIRTYFRPSAGIDYYNRQ